MTQRAKSEAAALEVLREIYRTVQPDDPDFSWSPDTIDNVGRDVAEFFERFPEQKPTA